MIRKNAVFDNLQLIELDCWTVNLRKSAEVFTFPYFLRPPHRPWATYKRQKSVEHDPRVSESVCSLWWRPLDWKCPLGCWSHSRERIYWWVFPCHIYCSRRCRSCGTDCLTEIVTRSTQTGPSIARPQMGLVSPAPACPAGDSADGQSRRGGCWSTSLSVPFLTLCSTSRTIPSRFSSRRWYDEDKNLVPCRRSRWCSGSWSRNSSRL